jgi:hypothetical protein
MAATDRYGKLCGQLRVLPSRGAAADDREELR